MTSDVVGEAASAKPGGRAKMVLAFMAVLLGGGGIGSTWPIIKDIVRPSPASQPSTTPCCTPSPPSAAPMMLRFVRPSGSIPHCNDFSGTGEIPDGYTLLIFDKGQTDANASYWFNKPAVQTAAGWIARSVQIGDGKDQGKRVEIIAVLVPKETGAYIASITTEPGAFWWSTQLPGRLVDMMTVERSADTTPCG